MGKKIPEKQLIKDSKNGNGAAFTELINAYRRNLFTYLLRICKDRMTAEDLFQDTLIKAWEGLKRYDEKQRFSSWLFTIAHNVSIDNIRRLKVRARRTNSADKTEISSGSTPYSEVVLTENKIALKKEVENLPEDQRRVFLLRQHSELSFKEIASIMNQPLNTVLSHMHYAVKKLKRCLNEE